MITGRRSYQGDGIESELEIYNVKKFGAKGDRSNGDKVAQQRALQRIRDDGGCGILYYPDGVYKAPDDGLNATGMQRLVIRGANRGIADLTTGVHRGATIEGFMTTAGPLLDLKGSSGAVVEDIALSPAGTATTGILIERNSDNLGDEVTLRNVFVNSAATVHAGVAVVGSDRPEFYGVRTYGKRGYYFALVDDLGISSIFDPTVSGNPQSTLNTVVGGACVAMSAGSGESLRTHRAGRISILGTEFSLDGTGTEFFRITGNAHTPLTVLGVRGEYHGGAGNTHIVHCDQALVYGGIIDGDFNVNGDGPLFRTSNSGAFVSTILKPRLLTVAGQDYFDGGLAMQCEIDNIHGLGLGVGGMAEGSYGNNVRHGSFATTDWFSNPRAYAVPYTNWQMSKHQTNIDALGIGSGSDSKPIINMVSAKVAINPISIAAGAVSIQVATVTGAAVNDTVILGIPGGLNSGLAVLGAKVQSTNTVWIPLWNTSGSAIDDGARDWTITAIRYGG